MVSEVKDIKPHDWKEIDLELIPRSYPFQIPQSLKNNRHLISQAFAAWYQLGNRPIRDLATLNFSIDITLNSFLPFLAAAGVNYGIPKAIETAKAWWSGKPSPDLVHTHNCIQQMLMPDFNEYGKAKVFLAAMSQNPKLFWTAQESKSLQGLVQAIPSDENPEKTKCDEVAKKAFKLVHQKYCSQQGWYTKITEGVPQISLDAIYAPFKKMFSLLGESEKGIGNFLRPFLEGFLRKTLDTLKISGSTYLPDTVERSDYEKHCDAVISMVGKVPYGQVLSGVLDHLFGQRYALAFGFKVPWVEPRVETSELPQPQRKKTVVPENPQTVDELIAETKQLQEQCVEKGSLFFWYWIFVHIIGSRDDVDITPCIKKVFASKEKGKDPLEEFYNAVIKQLDTSKTATWRRMLVKFIWNCTPLYSLSKFMMKRSIHAVEQWFEELRKRKESNEYDISEAKVIEAILKQWIDANKKINDQKAYEDEISEILLEGGQRKILINKLTNVLVDRCFPDIDFMGWCEDCDNNIANYHDQCHAVLAPFVWLGSYPVRGALLLLKFALLASQRVLNFLGRFGTKLIIKRFGVMQKVFDFRLRLQKGDHHNIEAKLKSLFLSAFIELNKINFDREPGNVDALTRFNSGVNQDVKQCVYILFEVLDMHATHDWSKGGITKALKGNFIEKYIREVALPTTIEKGIVLLNEIYQEFMGDPNKYQLVRRNIYRSMSEAFTDTSKPPPGIDADVRAEIHEFRRKIIRQIVLRTIAELGDDERKQAANFVKDLQKLNSDYTNWEEQLNTLKNMLSASTDPSKAVLDITALQENVEDGLEKIAATRKKYQKPLQSVERKMKEIYEGFSIPTQHIELSLETLESNLKSISKYIEVKEQFSVLHRANWQDLRTQITTGKIDEKTKQLIGHFADRVGATAQPDKHYLDESEKRSDALREMLLCDKAKLDIIDLQELRQSSSTKLKNSIRNQLLALQLDSNIDNLDAAIKRVNDKKNKITAQEIVERCDQVLSEISKLAALPSWQQICQCPSEERADREIKPERVKLKDYLYSLQLTTDIDDLDGVRQLIIDKQIATNQQSEIEICQKALSCVTELVKLKTWHQNQKMGSIKQILKTLNLPEGTDDLDAAMQLLQKKKEKAHLEYSVHALKKPDSILDLKKQMGSINQMVIFHLRKLMDTTPNVESTYRDNQRLELLKSLVYPNPFDIARFDRVYSKHNIPNEKESGYLDEVQNKLKQYAKICPDLFTQEDIHKWLDDEDAYNKIRSALENELQDLGAKMAFCEQETVIRNQVIDALFDEGLNKCNESLKVSKDQALVTIEEINGLLVKLQEKATDSNLSIPYFNFVYSPQQDGDNYFIEKFIEFIGSNVERTFQKILDLGKHPVFLSHILRQAALNAAATAA